MADFTVIPDTAIDPDAPLTAQLAYAWRDNPIAIAEGAISAPYVQSGWHPYDGVSVGDGADGTVYDFDIDGSVSSVETPDFEDGYEYEFRFENISGSSGFGGNFEIEFYRETSVAYSDAHTIFAFGSGVQLASGVIRRFSPRFISKLMIFRVEAVVLGSNATDVFTAADVAIKNTTAQKMLKARFSFDSGTIDRGVIRMFRRHSYV